MAGVHSLRADEETSSLDGLDDDTCMATELSKDLDHLTEGQLVERIKLIENWSYDLGCKEEQEMLRGEHLNILGPSSKR